jgi:hypothetical protein
MEPKSVALWATHDAFYQEIQLFSYESILILVFVEEIIQEEMVDDFSAVGP